MLRIKCFFINCQLNNQIIKLSYMVKNSFYNELIRIEETDEFLIFNIKSGGLIVASRECGDLLETVRNEPFLIRHYPALFEELNELENRGFLVPAEIDEKELHQLTYAQEQLTKKTNTSLIGLTIGTTILCNMGCPYCFQTVRPNKTLRDEKVINGVFRFVESMIVNAPVKKWEGFSVTWFGGEPLINKEGVEKLSQGFRALCNKYEIPYEASIITNGILLDDLTWKFLAEHQITSIQVTLDGAKETHDKYRPLKSANAPNYEKILENLTRMPDGFDVVVRVNTDKKVAATLPKLLDDFEERGLWPQRHRSVSLTLAWLKAYKGADVSNMINLTAEEYFETQNRFAEMKVERYNRWAKANGVTLSKLKWRIPEKQSDCPTWVSPYFYSIDPDGGLHKCWETLHDKSQSAGTDVTSEWNPKDYEKYISYSRTTVHPVCYNCKFNPVCEGLSCAHDALDVVKENEFPCTPWKTKLPEYFKKMYLEMKENPDMVAIQKPSIKKNETHANK